ncbi:MAG TPA: hypothetical protein VF244_03890 [Acidimicrobiales bacterium]
MGRLSLGSIIWIVIGVLVAADRGYLDHLDTLSGILSALLAVLVWPLLLLGIHIAV